jgi:hypothetical protein
MMRAAAAVSVMPGRCTDRGVAQSPTCHRRQILNPTRSGNSGGDGRFAGGLSGPAGSAQRLKFRERDAFNAHEIVPPAIVRPAEWRLHRRPRVLGMTEKIECHSHNGRLHLHVERRTARIAQRKVSEQEPGNGALLDYIPSRTHDDRRDAGLFQVPGDQTHGLVAHRSEGDEDRRVHRIFAAEPQHLRRVDVVRLALAVLCWDAVEARG